LYRRDLELPQPDQNLSKDQKSQVRDSFQNLVQSIHSISPINLDDVDIKSGSLPIAFECMLNHLENEKNRH
jgi:hypothetical protein